MSEPPADPPERITAREMLAQFFLIPLALAGICSAIFLGVNWMTARDRSAAEFAQELRDPDRRARWITALEAAHRRMNDPALVPVLAEVLADPGVDRHIGWSAMDALKSADEPRMEVRWFAAQALGRLNDPRAVGPLRAALGDGDGGVRVHAALALGELRAALGAGEALEVEQDLARALGADADAGVRKAAAFALGRYGGEVSREALARALADGDVQVRWNAALGLARRKDAAAADVVAEMLDRARVASARVPDGRGGVRSISEPEARQVLLGAIHAASALGAERFEEALSRLSRDASLEVQTLARRARIDAR